MRADLLDPLRPKPRRLQRAPRRVRAVRGQLPVRVPCRAKRHRIGMTLDHDGVGQAAELRSGNDDLDLCGDYAQIVGALDSRTDPLAHLFEPLLLVRAHDQPDRRGLHLAGRSLATYAAFFRVSSSSSENDG